MRRHGSATPPSTSATPATTTRTRNGSARRPSACTSSSTMWTPTTSELAPGARRSSPSPRTRSTATAATRRPTRRDITGTSRSRSENRSRKGRYRDRVNLELLAEELVDQPAYRVRQVWAWTARGASGYDEMTDLPAPLRTALAERIPFSTLGVEHEARSSDGTVKVLFRTADGHPVEAVLMRFRDCRRSVCVSSQSACPLTCSFCATGQMRFRRNLTASEILDQALHFRRVEPIDHCVF